MVHFFFCNADCLYYMGMREYVFCHVLAVCNRFVLCCSQNIEADNVDIHRSSFSLNGGKEIVVNSETEGEGG